MDKKKKIRFLAYGFLCHISYIGDLVDRNGDSNKHESERKIIKGYIRKKKKTFFFNALSFLDGIDDVNANLTD